MKNKTMEKKKLSEMSVDEFMQHGLDSDVSSAEEEEDIVETTSKLKYKTPINDKEETGNSTSNDIKTKSHKKQLERLKDKDPEFYKFLQENDEELLDFSGASEDEDDDDEGEEEDDDTTQSTKKKSKKEDDKGDESEGDESEEGDDDVQDDEENEEEQEQGKQVTTEMIKTWKISLEKESLKALKTVMSAFHASVSAMAPDDEETEKKKTRFIAKEGTTFNSLATMCLKYTSKILDKHVPYSKEKKSKQPMLPSSSKQWSKIKISIKQYLLDILLLLRQMSDASMLTIILRHCQSLCPFYACFPKITKLFLKRLVRMWSLGEEHVRVLAFLCIRKIVFLSPNLYEFTLKKLYFGYVQNSKFVTVQTKPVLVFMQNSLVEMFAINEVTTYQHAFVYIRQLAIHLRNAITIKKKDAHQSVYNWQFISCLQLWARVVGELFSDTLKPLVYPIVQITLGVARLVPSARYFPIRFQCIEILNYVSKKTGVYIPTASYVLEAIESKEFLQKPKSSEKTPDLKIVLKVTKTQIATKGFQDAVVDLAFECLLEHYVTFSSSIAFPELIFPVCHRLKRLTKDCKVFKLAKDMKTIVDKLKKHGDAVNKIRSSVTFSPKDLEQVNEWESQQKEKKNTLDNFYETWKRMKVYTDEKLETKNEEENSKENKKKLAGNNRKRKSQTNENDNDDNNKKVSVSESKIKKQKKKSTGGKQTKEKANHEDDIVEDFKFSDDEE